MLIGRHAYLVGHMELPLQFMVHGIERAKRNVNADPTMSIFVHISGASSGGENLASNIDHTQKS